MKIHCLNRSGWRIDGSRLIGEARQMLRLLDRGGRGRRRRKAFGGLRRLAIVCITPAESRCVNKMFLHTSHPANVLSFHYGDEAEVLLTPAVIHRQALAQRHPYRQELRRMLAHALLHLAGHHHEVSPRRAVAFEKREQNLLRHFKITSQRMSTVCNG